MTKKNKSLKAVTYRVEHCANPWNGKCEDSDIVLYIFYKSNRLPICRSCWNEIVDKNFEWG